MSELSIFINYHDFDANSQVFDPMSLNEATISWKCEGSLCDKNDILAQENITFPEVNFDSGKKYFNWSLDFV